MSVERPRRSASEAKTSGNAAKGVARAGRRPGAAWTTLLVALRGMEDSASTAEGGRAARYAAMRARAQEQRAEVLDYLRTNAEANTWRKPSDVTSFGTFTIDCTPAGQRVLRHAPHIQSVVRAGDTPLRIIR